MGPRQRDEPRAKSDEPPRARAQPSHRYPPRVPFPAIAPPIALSLLLGAAPPASPPAPVPAPAGMVWIPGGEFRMGSTDPLARPDERPVHLVRVRSFWMDRTEVTNRAFKAFVDATGYRTLAERPVDWEELKKQVPEGTPKPPDEMLKPGSLVFTPPAPTGDAARDRDTTDVARWWTWTTGACWSHPEGPGSKIDDRLDHPVVHIAFEDAVAYCAWAGKRLPTEAEWEFAARGGLDGKVNCWGDAPVDATKANIWQGVFPARNTAEDGFVRTAPVGRFPANGYGLVDMAGNVWEWTSDRFDPAAYARRARALAPGEAAVDPRETGPSRDPRNPLATDSRVHRGGSFLCNDAYCASYRPSARMAAPTDTSLAHLGFRCVKDVAGDAAPVQKDAESPNQTAPRSN